jgi:metal-dependent HD superfamily phosphatase/phosphodiesterase
MSDTDDSAADDVEAGRIYDPNAEHSFPDERVNEVLELIEDDAEIAALLEAQNVNPVTRKRYNDHGTKHVSIVRNRALCLYNLLKRGSVPFNGAADQGLGEADEAVIITLAATLHDIGHIVHRDDHPYYSIPLAADILDRLLDELSYYDIAESVRMKGEILHAIL